VIDRHLISREQISKSGAEQEGQGTTVDARAVCIGHRNRSETRLHLDREGKFAQISIYDGSHQRGGFWTGNHRQKIAGASAARPGQDTSIWQMYFHGIAGGNRLDFIVHGFFQNGLFLQ
jgi:hypothetical protein